MNDLEFCIKGRARTDEQKRAIIERLYALWTRDDRMRQLRLGQLIIDGTSGQDFFYSEDEPFLAELESRL